MNRTVAEAGTGRRLGLALYAAALGWLTASVLQAFYGGVLGYLRARYYGYVARWGLWHSVVVPAVYWSVFTGIFTLLATTVFILPYVALRSSAGILSRPWRMYVEPAALGVCCITLFDLHYHPSAYTVWRYFPMQVGYMAFALLTSLLSSFFFLRALRRQVRIVGSNCGSDVPTGEQASK